MFNISVFKTSYLCSKQSICKVLPKRHIVEQIYRAGILLVFQSGPNCYGFKLAKLNESQAKNLFNIPFVILKAIL